MNQKNDNFIDKTFTVLADIFNQKTGVFILPICLRKQMVTMPKP